MKQQLVCPRDKLGLRECENSLICPEKHTYPVVDDIPIMLVKETEPTHGYITSTLEQVMNARSNDRIQKEVNKKNGQNEIDDFVQNEIVHTCGNLYVPLKNRLTRYPIPEIRLQENTGERMLDVGCNWGRWTIAAAQKGYKPTGIDPSLDAVLAARRISRQLGVEANFVVGDARYLPFATDSFDVVFSYSVLQHFSKENVRISLDEIARVLKTSGKALIQMPNKYGVRSFYQQCRRGFSEGEGFDVRYWTPTELLKTFTEKFGKTKMSVDCYFGLGVQKSDIDLLPAPFKMVVHSSEILRMWSNKLALLMNVADSLYLESTNQKNN